MGDETKYYLISQNQLVGFTLNPEFVREWIEMNPVHHQVILGRFIFLGGEGHNDLR